jgi:hypothetical protein
MSLIPNFTIDQPISCSNFILIDNTGDYSSLTNPNGYGSPNPARVDITGAFADITCPDGTVVLAIPCTLPTTQPTETVIDATVLGVPVEDGIYIIRYYVVDGSTGQTYDRTRTPLYYCNVQCCFDKLLAKLPFEECCDCNMEELNTLTRLDWYIQGAIAAAVCGKVNKAKKGLAAAKFLCTQHKCNCQRS